MSFPDTLQLDVVTANDQLAALRDEWNATALASPQPNVFLTWEWTTTWWSHFGDGDELHVVVLRDSQGIAAIAPLQRTSIGVGPSRSTVLQRISPQAGDYGGIIVSRRTDEVVTALAGHLQHQVRRTRVSAVLLSRLPSDDPPIVALIAALRRRSEIEASEQRLDGISLFAEITDDFNLKKLAKKHKINQRTRRINEAYETVDFSYHTGDDLDRGLDILLQVHQRRWEGREDELQGLLAEPGQEAFMLDVIRRLDERGWVRLLTLSADGRPVAAELDFELGDRVVMFKGAFDPEFGEFSPGQLLHHQVMADGVDRQVDVIDFGRGEQHYKQRWANGERHLVSLTITRRGLWGAIATARMRGNRALAVRLAARAAR